MNVTNTSRICDKHGTPMRRYKNRGNPAWAQWHCHKCDDIRRKDWYASDPRRQLLYHARTRARLNSLPISISIEDIEIPTTCPVLGILLERGVGRVKDSSPSIDRKSPELGYIPGNIRVISWRANKLRSDATIVELEKVLAYAKGLL